VVLRHPVVRARAQAASAALRVSEAVRAEARGRVLASLDPERAGLLLGMALGDTSQLPSELDHDFRAAGLTHLMAVSGANLAVVVAAGLWLAGAAGVPSAWPWSCCCWPTPGLAGARGFQLSVAATAGVLWIGPAAARALPGWIPARARTAVGITLGAQAAAAPALGLALGRLSLAGLPANLLGLPLARVA
jgi:competence protein ComEC